MLARFLVLFMVIGAVTVLGVMAIGWIAGTQLFPHASATDLALSVRENQFTDHELIGAVRLSEAQKNQDEGQAALIEAHATEQEQTNASAIILAIFFLGLVALVGKGLSG